MAISPSRGVNQFLLRSLLPAIVYLLTELFLDVFRGDELYARRVITAFLAGWFLALIMCAVANHLPWRAAERILVLWFFMFITRGINILLEWYFFSTEGLPTILRAGVSSTIVSAALAVAAALLFPPMQPKGALSSSVRSLLARRGRFSWAWRMAAGVVTYVFVYFLFGAIAFQFTEPYYTDPAYGLNLTLPSADLVFKLQFVRGFTYLLASFFVLSGLRVSKLRQAWLLGMALFILGGLSPLISVEELPVALRVYHTVEIFFQNFTAGVMLALLLGVAPPREQPGHSSVPAP